MCGQAHPQSPEIVCRVQHKGRIHNDGSGVSWTVEWKPTQEAVDWARAAVERVIEKYRRFEQESPEESKHQWRVLAYYMEMDLIGTGCVIGPFNERAVEIQELIDRA